MAYNHKMPFKSKRKLNINAPKSVGLILAGLWLGCLGLTPGKAQKTATLRPRGASVPFTTYEAESVANRVRGSRITMVGLPLATDSKPAMEASGRAFVELSALGDFVELPRVRAANALVLRHCIPDATNGGGISASLSLYVNGKKRQKLTLSSRHAWLYGAPGENGQDNDPAKGQPHVFWDEARFFITGGVRAGDTVRLQKDVGDSAAFYRIDLLDLETAPAPRKPPAANTFLSINDFGANGRDTLDDTQAIQKCIAAAKAQKKVVWMPAGTYYQSKKFSLDGVEVRGAGMWHTNLVGTVEGTTWFGEVGFDLAGNGPKVSDLSIDSAAHTARSEGGKPFTGAPDNWRIENVWITHSLTGIWLNGRNGVVRGCRVRDTYADGINLNIDAANNLIENNHVRGCGDDGIALLSESEFKKPPAAHNIVRFNTVSAIWWGHNCDIAGGSGHVIEDNIFADNPKMGVFTLNLPGAFPMHPLKDAIIRRNTFLRGGGNYAGQERGAVWIYPGSTTVSNILFADNLIRDSIFRAIHFAGSQRQTVTFRRNLIEGSGRDAIYFGADVTGTTTFQNNVVRGLPKAGKTIVNDAKASVSIIQVGNSWQ